MAPTTAPALRTPIVDDGQATPSEAAVRAVAWAAELTKKWDITMVCEQIVQADLVAAFPDYRDDEGFIVQLRHSVCENLEIMRGVLTGTGPITGIVPEKPARFAETQAQLGTPQATLHHSYRIGFLTFWRYWSQLIETESPALGISDRDHLDLLRWSTDRLLTYIDVALVSVSASYTSQEEARRRTGAQVRQQVVREILNDTSTLSSKDVLLTLGYDLSICHVAVQVMGLSDAEIDQLAARFRSSSGIAGVLAVRLTTSDVVMWLGRLRSWSEAQLTSLIETLREFDPVVALSEPATGAAGFRAGYEQVKQVESVRDSWPDAPTVLTYPQVRLEALLMADLVAARRFMTHELGVLAEDSETAARLRETLMTSFTLNSHVAAAERLRLHEHTVRNRLQRAEEALGHPLTERRVEVQVALRLRQMLGHRDALTGPTTS